MLLLFGGTVTVGDLSVTGFMAVLIAAFAGAMLVMGIIALVVGFVVLVVLKIIGSLANGLISLIF